MDKEEESEPSRPRRTCPLPARGHPLRSSPPLTGVPPPAAAQPLSSRSRGETRSPHRRPRSRGVISPGWGPTPICSPTVTFRSSGPPRLADTVPNGASSGGATSVDLVSGSESASAYSPAIDRAFLPPTPPSGASPVDSPARRQTRLLLQHPRPAWPPWRPGTPPRARRPSRGASWPSVPGPSGLGGSAASPPPTGSAGRSRTPREAAAGGGLRSPDEEPARGRRVDPHLGVSPAADSDPSSPPDSEDLVYDSDAEQWLPRSVAQDYLGAVASRC